MKVYVVYGEDGYGRSENIFGIHMKKKYAEAAKNLLMEQLYEKNKDNAGIEFGIMEIDSNDLVDLWHLN